MTTSLAGICPAKIPCKPYTIHIRYLGQDCGVGVESGLGVITGLGKCGEDAAPEAIKCQNARRATSAPAVCGVARNAGAMRRPFIFRRPTWGITAGNVARSASRRRPKKE